MFYTTTYLKPVLELSPIKQYSLNKSNIVNEMGVYAILILKLNFISEKL